MKKTENIFRFKGEEDREPLHYIECGLDDIYLCSGYTTEKTPHGEGVSIKKLDELHKAIGLHLTTQKKALSGKELRFLRKQMDLTQSELGKIVGLSSQQVARWEKGESDISGPADALLRWLYIDHIDNKEINIRELLKNLDEVDSPINEKYFFEPTARGWRAKKAA